MDLLGRSRVFSSERRARNYYRSLRWQKSKRRCFECGSVSLLVLADSRYKCKVCGVRFNDFTQTYLSGLKLEFHQVAWLVYYFCLELSVHRSAKELGVNYKTAYNFFNRIRRAIAANDCWTGLSGEVEI